MTEATGARVLVVDDEPAIARALRTNLSGHGFRVEVAANGREALESYSHWHPDVIILDLGLPDIDGVEVLKRIRAVSAVPVIVLSVREAEHDKVTALELGADDYMTKPFGVGELLARMRVALRHAARPAAGAGAIVQAGEIELDLERRRVSVGGNEVHLSPTEYELLKIFLTNADRILTDQMLLRQVWGPGYGEESHYLHVYVARLRRKIEPDPQRPRHLVTEPGVGYRFLSSAD